MAIGIISDLAVGVSKGGADAWMWQEYLAAGFSVGAPPDFYNQRGQTWSQPPWKPEALAAAQFEPFRQVVRSALSGLGGVRIDHILGAFRSWWVPDDGTPANGFYVENDHRALLDVIVREAKAANALVIGEDLGVIPEHARDELLARGILGTSVLWFEIIDGVPIPQEQWRSAVMAAVTTHDLPPTAVFLRGEHIDLRARLGLLTVSIEEERAKFFCELHAWSNFLPEAAAQKLRDGEVDTEVILECYKLLAGGNAELLNLALVDAVGDVQIQNQPGTAQEHPNWRAFLRDETGARVLVESLSTLELPSRFAEVLNLA